MGEQHGEPCAWPRGGLGSGALLSLPELRTLQGLVPLQTMLSTASRSSRGESPWLPWGP